MSAKYAFTQSLREVRFHFCQSSDHSAATRYVHPRDLSLPPSLALSTAYVWHPSFALRSILYGKIQELRDPLVLFPESPWSAFGSVLTNTRPPSQILHNARLPNHEEEQPAHPDHDTGGLGRGAADVCEIRYVRWALEPFPLKLGAEIWLGGAAEARERERRKSFVKGGGAGKNSREIWRKRKSYVWMVGWLFCVWKRSDETEAS